MNNFIQSYELILEKLIELKIDFSNFIQIRTPQLKNIELIALNLTAEYKQIDSECQLFREIEKTYLFSKIERSVYNKRKRKMFPFIEQVRKKISAILTEFEDYYIVDSMPLAICKNARAARSTICKEQENTMPNRGYCASQKMHYYGYKLHAVSGVNGVFTSIDFTPASVHDIHFLQDIKDQMKDSILIGDKGYLSAQIKLDLFHESNITLETPMRRNQKNYKPQAYIFRKSRKRIETLFSQLCDQFMIRRNYAKTFEGFKTRIVSKITALTMIQFLNKFTLNKNINNIKSNIC
jgi:Transposase DDE domain